MYNIHHDKPRVYPNFFGIEEVKDRQYLSIVSRNVILYLIFLVKCTLII